MVLWVVEGTKNATAPKFNKTPHSENTFEKNERKTNSVYFIDLISFDLDRSSDYGSRIGIAEISAYKTE